MTYYVKLYNPTKLKLYLKKHYFTYNLIILTYHKDFYHLSPTFNQFFWFPCHDGNGLSVLFLINSTEKYYKFSISCKTCQCFLSFPAGCFPQKLFTIQSPLNFLTLCVQKYERLMLNEAFEPQTTGRHIKTRHCFRSGAAVVGKLGS